MILIGKLNSTSGLSIAAFALACVVAALAIRGYAVSNESALHRYLQVLPSIALEMIKAQSSLEASDGKVLVESQIIMLEASFSKLLTRQSSSFDQRRLAMKIEIQRSEPSTTEKIDRELHRFGFIECEPEAHLGSQMTTLMEPSQLTSKQQPQYQVTLCYLNRDGSILKSSASSTK
ncbi:hypothetical protein A1OO_14295 [Enterovibrio norvegicus FF-33]|uniref:Uncharacterized protein n=1 Tax=Enterovibrio norvegicus FF-454 TaxID=1185651 RepID=A0A1E5CBX7_9GAMM|nr:hypothetical protein [Enterovibrio norvegicus]OEE63008.1 hypothetical protein A1OK_20715 [Enterovibrio norvegicus FF-454]OEE66931.1 hypothetical protein A1OO_14295 [Enterovibrio norvegicus FF-33]